MPATANNLIRLKTSGDGRDVIPLNFRTASNQIVRSRPSSPPLRVLQCLNSRLAATIRYAVRAFHSVSARVIDFNVHALAMRFPTSQRDLYEPRCSAVPRINGWNWPWKEHVLAQGHTVRNIHAIAKTPLASQRYLVSLVSILRSLRLLLMYPRAVFGLRTWLIVTH